MVLDASLFNTQHYKVGIKGKEYPPLLHLSVVTIEKGAFGLPTLHMYIHAYVHMLK